MNSWIRELGFPVVRVVLEPPSGGDPNNTVSYFYSQAVSNRLQSQVGRVFVIVWGVHLNPLKDYHAQASSISVLQLLCSVLLQ